MRNHLRALAAPHPGRPPGCPRHPRQSPATGPGYAAWHPVGLPKGYHVLPRGQVWRTRPGAGSRGCPRGSAWSGCARPTGCHTTTSAQDQPLGPSLGRETSGSTEKPREVARAFPLVNPTASSHWSRWRGAGRTSWPVSRILWLYRATINRMVRRDTTSTVLRSAKPLRNGCKCGCR